MFDITNPNDRSYRKLLSQDEIAVDFVINDLSETLRKPIDPNSVHRGIH